MPRHNYVLAGTYCEIRAYDKAYPYLNKYIEQDSSISYFYEVRGGIHWDRYEYKKAVDDYHKAIELHPTASSYSNRSLALIELEQYEEALLNLSQAVALDSTFAFAYNNMATIYLKQAQPDSAIYQLQKSLELEPNNAYLMKNYALYYEQIGERDSICISLRGLEELRFYSEIKEMTDSLYAKYCE